MPGLQGNRFLDSSRLKILVQTLASELEKNRPLIYLNRTPVVNAFDDEIIGRWTGSVIAADIIADDQEAVVQEAGKIELTSNTIPNLKIGQRLGQGILNRLSRVKAGLASAAENTYLVDWENMLAENLVLGVRQRMNALICAMHLDALNYDRMGIQLSNVSWGMPSNLKVTPSVAWSTAATATPIADIFSMDQVATDAYGRTFNRVTMSSTAFRYMTATTEFRDQATFVVGKGFVLSAGNLAVKNDSAMQTIAGQILNKTIEIDDATFNERTNAGAKVTSRYLPANKVILSNTQDDSDPNVMDFANAVTTESIVDSMSGEGAEEFGPYAYWNGREDRNPPDIVAWAVTRGFPRKFVPESTAVLTVY